MGRAADAIVGGWTISSIVTLQSGPYLTPTMSGGDPSGTNAPNRGTQRPDRIGEGSVSNPTADLVAGPERVRLPRPCSRRESIQLQRRRGCGTRPGAARPVWQRGCRDHRRPGLV